MNGPQPDLPELLPKLASTFDPDAARSGMVPTLRPAAALSAFFDALPAAPAATLLRAAGCSKAQAGATVLEESRHENTGKRNGAYAYLGDDITDENALRALDQQAIGRRSLTVVVREQWRQTAATTWIRPPQGLLDFLDRWQAALAP